MNQNLTEIVFILDRSGSMAGLENDTIGGFNGFVKKQAEAGQTSLSTVLFDDTGFCKQRVMRSAIHPPATCASCTALKTVFTA